MKTVIVTTEPILARLNPQAFGDPAEAPAEFMAFPAGVHVISATQAGKPIRKQVHIDASTAVAMQEALLAHNAGEQKAYFDFDHDDTKASAWPKSYRWEDGSSGKKPGVYAAVEWSGSGAAAVLGKDYRSFSPAFHVDESTPARVIDAPINMGGLVNAPAFRAQAPVLSKHHSAVPPTNQQNNVTMTEEEKAAADKAAAIQAKQLAQETRLAALEAKETKRKAAAVTAAINAAVARGALPAKNEAIHAKWKGLLEADEANAELLDGLPGRDLTQVITASGVQIDVSEGLITHLRGFAAEKDSVKAGAIYARYINPQFKDGLSMGPILAANSLGTVAGTLVVQRSLSLLKLTFPWLFKQSTDFSAEGANFGQTVTTRLRAVPTAVNFVPGTGYLRGDAVTTNVPVVIDQHKGVEIAFNANELASTNRDLFGEQVEGMHYALGKAFADHLLSLVTVANFANESIEAVADVDADTMDALDAALVARGVVGPRAGLFTSAVFRKLGKDASIVQLATFQMKEIITHAVLPQIKNIQPYEVINMPAPAGENLIGFAGTGDALAFATRTPNDYTAALPGANNGSVGVITNTDTGISVQEVKYVDHVKAEAAHRIAVMYGAAKGNPASAQRLISAPRA